MLSRVARNLLQKRSIYSAASRVFQESTDISKLKTSGWMRQGLVDLIDGMRGMPVVPLEQSKLEPRRMSDSHARFVIPLASDARKREKYSTAGGNVRFGKILEDLDIFAVWLCYLHDHGGDFAVLKPRHARVIVTGSVHRIDLQNFDFATNRDLILDGHVSWTGNSSMQTTMRIYQCNEKGSLEQMLKAKFVMVSRNPEKPMESMPVHPLLYPTPEEALIYNQGVDDMLESKKMDEKSVFRQPPTIEEYEMLHKLFIKAANNQGFASRGTLPDHVKLEHKPFGEMLMPCYPEHKNIYGKIFGGYLMRSAFELAAVCSKLFAKTSTELIAVDDIVFRAPVDVGDVLSLYAHVTYSRDCLIQVRVQAQVVNERSFERKTTNTFHFTFTTRSKAPAPKIVPVGYKEGMMNINGKRHMESALKYRGVTLKMDK